MYPWPDWMTPYIPSWLVGAAVVVAALWLLVATIQKLWLQVWVTWLGPLRKFLEDWNGEDARDGVPGHPSVMARLEALEEQGKTAAAQGAVSADRIKELEDTGRQTAIKIDEIQMNVKPNGGSSAHDKLAKRLDELHNLVVDSLKKNHPDYRPPFT